MDKKIEQELIELARHEETLEHSALEGLADFLAGKLETLPQGK